MREDLLLRRHALPGAIGSATLAVGALAMGWIPPLFNVEHILLLGVLRTTTAGELLGRGAVLIGGAVLMQSWLLLGTDVLSGQIQRRRSLHRVLALWCTPALLVPPLFSRDPYSYFAQGQLLVAGIDPYRNGVAALRGWFLAGVDPMWAETSTPYGPLFLMIERAIAGIPGATPYWAAIGFRLVALAGVALMSYAVPRIAELHGIRGDAAYWLAVMNPLVLMHFVFGAHNDALMVGVMLAALAVAMHGPRAWRSRVIALLLLSTAVAIKPIAIVLTPFLVLLMLPRDASLWLRLRAYVAGGVGVLAPVIVLGMLIGVGSGWTQALTTPGSVRTWLSPPTALGMAIGLVGDVVGAPWLDDAAVHAIRLAAMCIAILFCARLVLFPAGRTPVRGAALALACIIWMGPVVQPWYLLWALPLIAASGLRKPWHLKAVVLGTAAFVFYGLSEPTATSDAYLDLVDSLGMLMALAATGLALLVSPHERELATGTQFGTGLAPSDQDAKRRAASWMVQ